MIETVAIWYFRKIENGLAVYFFLPITVDFNSFTQKLMLNDEKNQYN